MRQAAGALAGALALGYAALAVAAAFAQGKPGPTAEQKRGAYLARIMDCGGCHTPGALVGKPDQLRYLAGSEIGFEIPGVGIFYPPNLTPDRETGLGNWSAAEIIKAVRTGARPDGRLLVPIMPYHSYGELTDTDAKALAAYLKSMPPVHNKAPGIVGPSEKPSAAYLKLAIPE
ncbi:c-type cytochrome [Desertibaculum subflavum]|uniref:c-type cytochrome n=1 Tax=Desertibaculum subflavum TaxID=2268458 RepID=UPI000E665684